VGDFGPDIGVDISPGVSVEARIATDFVRLLSSSDEELAERLRQLEASPVFRTLRQAGVVMPVAASPVRYLDSRNSPARLDQVFDGINLAEPAVFLEHFVRVKGLSKEVFERFLRGDVSPSRIIDFCACSKPEARQFEQAIESFVLSAAFEKDAARGTKQQPVRLKVASPPLLLVDVA
jgi:hypothetical protein